MAEKALIYENMGDKMFQLTRRERFSFTKAVSRFAGSRKRCGGASI